MKNFFLPTCLIMALAIPAFLPGTSAARERVAESPLLPVIAVPDTGDFAAQGSGASLSQAVQSVRRRPEVERIIDAKTQVRNGREVHLVRAMTKDGKVKTYEIPGRNRK